MARKRAPGGGRKAKSANKKKSDWLMVRVTPDIRALIEHEAAKKGRTLSAEIAARLKRREPSRDVKMKALCFLIAEAADALIGSYVPDGKGSYVPDPSPQFNWRVSPFMFEAFKQTVIQLLDALRPQGEIMPPISNLAELAAADRWSQAIARSFANPEERARDTFMLIWQRLKSDQPLAGDELTGAKAHRRFDEIERHYGFADARYDLLEIGEKS